MSRTINARSKWQPIVSFHLSRLIAGRKIIIDVTLEKRGNEEGVDSTCSESSLSGRAKGMGDRDDLTKGREEWWTTKMVVRAWRREKNLANGMKRDGERDEWFTHGWVETLRIERDASDRGKVTRRREAGWTNYSSGAGAILQTRTAIL